MLATSRSAKANKTTIKIAEDTVLQFQITQTKGFSLGSTQSGVTEEAQMQAATKTSPGGLTLLSEILRSEPHCFGKNLFHRPTKGSLRI